MELDSIEELNKLESQIKETQKLLKKNDGDKSEIKKLKRHKVILGILMLLFLTSSVWLYFFKKNNSSMNFNTGEKFIKVNKDSIRFYKDFYQNFQINDVKDGIINKLTLDSQKIIYNVQLGAFQNFKLTSNSLMNLREFTEDGYTKFSIGNFTTYSEALTLKYRLKKLGFSDCFIISKSFGKQIEIYDALVLSNETEYLQ